MFKKILVAIDDSQPSACALSAAIELAAQVRAAVILLHVVDSSLAYLPDRGAIDTTKLAALRADGQELLNKTVAQLPMRSNVQRLLVEGDPAECVLNTASDWQAD